PPAVVSAHPCHRARLSFPTRRSSDLVRLQFDGAGGVQVRVGRLDRGDPAVAHGHGCWDFPVRTDHPPGAEDDIERRGFVQRDLLEVFNKMLNSLRCAVKAAPPLKSRSASREPAARPLGPAAAPPAARTAADRAPGPPGRTRRRYRPRAAARPTTGSVRPPPPPGSRR